MKLRQGDNKIPNFDLLSTILHIGEDFSNLNRTQRIPDSAQ